MFLRGRKHWNKTNENVIKALYEPVFARLDKYHCVRFILVNSTMSNGFRHEHLNI